MKRLLAVGALVLARAMARAVTCDPTDFVQVRTFPTQTTPRAGASGDFNNDGVPDVATVSSSQAVVSVLLANGSGSFGTPIDSPTIIGDPGVMTAALLDAGPTVDLAIGYNEGQVAVLLGNGDGTFQPAAAYAAGEWPVSVVAVDLTGDGILDLLEGSSFRDGLFVLPGLGGGAFGAAQVHGAPDEVNGIASGDFDEDGIVDVAISTNANAISLYPGLGGGALGPPVRLEVGSVGPVVSADLDGDGHVDIAVGTGTYAAVLHGNGDGTFGAALAYALLSRPVGLIAADLNADGLVDLSALTLTTFAADASLIANLLQKPDGSFQLRGAYHAGSGTVGFARGLFDGDAIPDFVAVNRDTASIALLFGQGDGSLRAPLSLPFGAEPRHLAQGDFAEEGRPQLAVLGSSNGGTLAVYRSANGRASLMTLVDVGSYPLDFDVADFDGDGHLDVVVATWLPELEIFRGRGDGTFEPSIHDTLDTTPASMVAGDFTGDGRPDLAIADYSGQLTVFLNDGGGGLSPGQVVAANAWLDLIAERLDADPILDLAVTGGAGDTVVVLLGAGDGTFGSPTPFATGPGPSALAAGDFNQDEVPDLILADGTGTTVSVLLGDGSGSFSSPNLVEIGTAPRAVTVGDFDNDGFLDAATADAVVGKVSLLHGTGDGGFETPVVLEAGLAPSSILAFHSGGLVPDLVVGNVVGYEVEIFVNSQVTVTPVLGQFAVVGSRVQIPITASGLGPLSYQWRKGGVPLTDGGSISGATTPTLTIDPVSFADAGSYDVVVTDVCGSVTSNAAPLSIEFADVPVSSPFHADILAIATAGITSGCGGGNYCPTSPVRRDQMAVFLLKAEHGAAYTPPGCTGVFADVPCPSAFADWIEQLAAEGITGGCGGGNYCPGTSVTRAQMAVFLLKTSQGSGYTPPAATGSFGDVPVGSFAADFIEDLYNRGITGGCQTSPPLYCPNNAVLRQQMATFIARTFFP